MEREVLVRLQRATASNNLIAQQYTETMDITANEFFKNIINLYMGQPLQLYTSNKAAWNDLKQQRTDNVGKYINKVQKFIRLFQFTLDPLTLLIYRRSSSPRCLCLSYGCMRVLRR